MSGPRAYTAEETADKLIAAIRATAAYWAALPSFDRATGRWMTTNDRCEGVAFSILSILDGCSLDLPGFDLVATPHPDDKAFMIAEGCNWVEPGCKLSFALHERFSGWREVQG